MSTTRNEDVEKTEAKERITEIQRDTADLRYELRNVRSIYGAVPRKLHCSYHCSVLEYHDRLMPCVLDSATDRVYEIWGVEDEADMDVNEYRVRLTSGRQQTIDGLSELIMFDSLQYTETEKKDDLINGTKENSETYQDIIQIPDLKLIHSDLNIVAHELGYGSPADKQPPTYELG